MAKKFTKLGELVHNLRKKSSESDVSRVNKILDHYALHDQKTHDRVVRWALKALSSKSKKMRASARNVLILFLCKYRETLTEKQRIRFVARVEQFQPELQFQFGVKRKS